MSRRNLLVLFLAFGGLLLCYNRADRNRYVKTLADALSTLDFYTSGQPALCVNRARPQSPRHLPSAGDPAGMIPAFPDKWSS